MNADLPEVSIVIVTWNPGHELLNCLQSLLESPPSVGWDAIVVDNGSSNDTIEHVRAEFPWARVIRNARNRGLAAANNQGIAASRAPFVLISNPDVYYASGAIDALLDVLHRRSRGAFVVARLIHPDGELQTSAGDLPSVTAALLGRRLSWHHQRGERSGTWWHDWAHDEERTIGHGAEACYLVRRSAIAEIGLQDERFVLDWEGLDWSSRAWRAGWEVWFSPSATVTHVGGTSVRQAPTRWIASTHLGMYRYLSARVNPLLRPLLALLVAGRGLVKLAIAKVEPKTYDLAHRGR